MMSIDHWQWLMSLKCVSLSLERNPHAYNYRTAREWIEGCAEAHFADCDPADVQAMKDTNEVWSLTIYSDSHYRWYAATAERVVDVARAKLELMAMSNLAQWRYVGDESGVYFYSDGYYHICGALDADTHSVSICIRAPETEENSADVQAIVDALNRMAQRLGEGA